MANTTFPYEEIFEHCKQEKPNEACGIVVLFKGRYKWIPCENISQRPTTEFAISPLAFANAEDFGDIVAIVHSHPYGPSNPSGADIDCQKQQGIDWLIVSLDNTEPSIYWLKSEKKEQPLYGRKYVWHVQDCGSFIQDFYKQEFNITIPDFYRPERFWERGLEIYLDCYREAGFHEIEMKDLRYGDLVLMALGTSITTHGAVYIGNNKIAHHLNDRLSCRDVYGKYYMDRTTKCLRYKDELNVKNN